MSSVAFGAYSGMGGRPILLHDWVTDPDVWLSNNTGKSVLAAILFHDMVNVSEFSFPNYGSHYDPFIAGAITAVIVVIVTFFWSAKTLARYRYAVRDTLSV